MRCTHRRSRARMRAEKRATRPRRCMAGFCPDARPCPAGQFWTVIDPLLVRVTGGNSVPSSAGVQAPLTLTVTVLPGAQLGENPYGLAAPSALPSKAMAAVGKEQDQGLRPHGPLRPRQGLALRILPLVPCVGGDATGPGRGCAGWGRSR